MKSELKEDLKLADAEHYPATIADIENFETENQQYGPSYRWVFTVDDGKNKGEMSAITTQNYKASTKLGAFVFGLLGELPKVFDTEDVIGKEYMVEVAKQRNKDGTVKKTKMDMPYFTVVGIEQRPQRRLPGKNAEVTT